MTAKIAIRECGLEALETLGFTLGVARLRSSDLHGLGSLSACHEDEDGAKSRKERSKHEMMAKGRRHGSARPSRKGKTLPQLLASLQLEANMCDIGSGVMKGPGLELAKIRQTASHVA